MVLHNPKGLDEDHLVYAGSFHRAIVIPERPEVVVLTSARNATAKTAADRLAGTIRFG